MFWQIFEQVQIIFEQLQILEEGKIPLADISSNKLEFGMLMNMV